MADDEIRLRWCKKHKEWFVENCPDCMIEQTFVDVGGWLKNNCEYHQCDDAEGVIVRGRDLDALLRGEKPGR